MKCLAALLTLLLLSPLARADIQIGKFDMTAVKDTASLETKVIQDWQPMPKEPALRQKLIEITVCEWWPGMKVRLPVSFLAPADKACTNVLIENTGLQLKPTGATGAKLRLAKEHGVGLVFIGMVPIDQMEPLGQVHTMMEAHFLQTKDARYTPAWIWGISDMRAITAAFAEKEVFQPKKVLVTGGSKRGVATATAGIHDDRVTAIMPVVAPVIESPGGTYVEGMLPDEITKMNEAYLAKMPAGKGKDALLVRQKARSDERITLPQARAAGWNDAEIKDACNKAWAVCNTTAHLDALAKRGVDIFYNQGSNDNVSPGLVALGERFPQLPVFVVPGGQHGGAKEAGFVKSVGGMPEVDDNLYAFASHHFFGARRLIAPPKLTTHWDKAAHEVTVKLIFPDGTEPQKNDLHWSVNRHPDYSIDMEFDAWSSIPLQRTGTATYEAKASIANDATTVHVITVHAQTENGSTLTVSSPEVMLR